MSRERWPQFQRERRGEEGLNLLGPSIVMASVKIKHGLPFADPEMCS
jgi:hypothetical protein